MEDEASWAEAACALAPLDNSTEAALMDLVASPTCFGDGANVADGVGDGTDHFAKGLHKFVLRGTFANVDRQIAPRDFFGRCGHFVQDC